MKQRAYRSLADFLAVTGTTQVEFARRVGCDQSVISKVAAGVTSPGFRLALRISRAANVPIESLMPSLVSCGKRKRAA